MRRAEVRRFPTSRCWKNAWALFSHCDNVSDVTEEPWLNGGLCASLAAAVDAVVRVFRDETWD